MSQDPFSKYQDGELVETRTTCYVEHWDARHERWVRDSVAYRYSWQAANERDTWNRAERLRGDKPARAVQETTEFRIIHRKGNG